MDPPSEETTSSNATVSERGHKRELPSGESELQKSARRKLDHYNGVKEEGGSDGENRSPLAGEEERVSPSKDFDYEECEADGREIGEDSERDRPRSVVEDNVTENERKETEEPEDPEDPEDPEEREEPSANEEREAAVNENGTSTESMVISDADASFILGTGGRTKRKLARVARCELNVTQTANKTVLEMTGSLEAIDRARTYISFVIQQRVGPVRLSPKTEQRDDLVILDIPNDCVGYVTGHKGQGLRSVEEEFATLMFFTDVVKDRLPADAPETEKLVIFSPCQRARQGAVLKVMSAIEQKCPGHFTSNVTAKIWDTEGFDVDITPVEMEDYSYALGKGGATRKKLARASGAILEYIGQFAFIAGDKKERERGRQYLKWLCSQRVGAKKSEEDSQYPKARDDLLTMEVPVDCVAYVTGHRGQALRKVEELTGTFMFLDGKRGNLSETLFIFGESQSGRQKARELAARRIREKQTGPVNSFRSSDRNNPSSYSSGARGSYYGHDAGGPRGRPDEMRNKWPPPIRRLSGPHSYYRGSSLSPRDGRNSDSRQMAYISHDGRGRDDYYGSGGGAPDQYQGYSNGATGRDARYASDGLRQAPPPQYRDMKYHGRDPADYHYGGSSFHGKSLSRRYNGGSGRGSEPSFAGGGGTSLNGGGSEPPSQGPGGPNNRGRSRRSFCRGTGISPPMTESRFENNFREHHVGIDGGYESRRGDGDLMVGGGHASSSRLASPSGPGDYHSENDFNCGYREGSGSRSHPVPMYRKRDTLGENSSNSNCRRFDERRRYS